MEKLQIFHKVTCGFNICIVANYLAIMFPLSNFLCMHFLHILQLHNKQTMKMLMGIRFHFFNSQFFNGAPAALEIVCLHVSESICVTNVSHPF